MLVAAVWAACSFTNVLWARLENKVNHSSCSTVAHGAQRLSAAVLRLQIEWLVLKNRTLVIKCQYKATNRWQNSLATILQLDFNQWNWLVVSALVDFLHYAQETHNLTKYTVIKTHNLMHQHYISLCVIPPYSGPSFTLPPGVCRTHPCILRG